MHIIGLSASDAEQEGDKFEAAMNDVPRMQILDATHYTNDLKVDQCYFIEGRCIKEIDKI